jgi:HK97 family phage prohead protease
LEERTQPVQVDGRMIRGLIPYGVESCDMGGWREVIEPTALHGADLSDLVVTVDHAGLPLGRHPNTLTLEDRDDGMHWSCEPPRRRADVIEAVERGDLRAASWRMLVSRDEWRGDVRHVHKIAELRDVSITAAPAYPSATVELRSQPEPEETAVSEVTTTPEDSESPQEVSEPRSIPTPSEEARRASMGPLAGSGPARAVLARVVDGQ